MGGSKKSYITWVLGVEKITPKYMVREKTQRENLRGKAVKKTSGYEERVVEEGESEIARRPREIRERGGQGRLGLGRKKRKGRFLRKGE